jgi:hypothetical protein
MRGVAAASVGESTAFEACAGGFDVDRAGVPRAAGRGAFARFCLPVRATELLQVAWRAPTKWRCDYLSEAHRAKVRAR